MNRKRWISIILTMEIVIVIASISMFLWNFCHLGTSEAETIKLNWNIDLTAGSEDIYYKDIGPSFHGDGSRISVMKYPDFDAVEKIVNWQDSPNKEVESKVSDILTNELQIDAKYMPDFKTPYKYYCYKKDSLNTIYLIYKPSENYLYAVEDLY